jgi:hypothetical protein
LAIREWRGCHAVSTDRYTGEPRLRDGGHPDVGFDGENVGAALDHLHRGNPVAGTYLQHAVRIRCQHIVDQLVGIARTIRVVVLCRAAARLTTV